MLFLIGKQFTPHDLCDENHERRVETRVQALMQTMYNNAPDAVRSYDEEKLITLNWSRHVEFIAFKMDVTGTLQEECFLTWHIYLIIAFGCHVFRRPGRKQK
jgi:hypothetical protein